MYKSFTEALDAQKGMALKIEKAPTPKDETKGRPRQAESVESFIPSADARTEALIASRMRRS